jgi:hypothetical protein
MIGVPGFLGDFWLTCAVLGMRCCCDMVACVQISWDPATAFDMEDDSFFPSLAAGGDRISDVLLNETEVEFRFTMVPLNVHWHDTSEHSVGGYLVRSLCCKWVRRPYTCILHSATSP